METSKEDQPIWVQDLLAWLEKIKGDEKNFAELVQELLAELPGGKLPRFFWCQKEGAEEVKGVEVALSSLSGEDIDRIQHELDVVQRIENDKARAEGLIAIAAQLPIAYRQSILQEAIDAAQKIELWSNRSEVICEMAEQIPVASSDLIFQILELSLNLEDPRAYSWTLKKVASQLPAIAPCLISKVLDAACKFKDEEDRYKALIEVISRLPINAPQLLPTAYEAVQHFNSKYFQSKVLAAIAAAHPPYGERVTLLLQQALDAAGGIESECDRWEVLLTLAKQIATDSPDLRPRVKSFYNFNPKDYQWEVLLAVAKLTQDSDELQSAHKTALDIALEVDSNWGQFKSIQAERSIYLLVQQLSTKTFQSDYCRSVLQRVLDNMKSFGDDFISAQKILAEVSAQLSTYAPELLKQALKAAKEMYPGGSRTANWEAIAEVVSYLPSDQRDSELQQVLEEIQKIEDKNEYLYALTEVASHNATAGQDVLKKIIQIASDFEEKEHKISVLTPIAFQSIDFLLIHCSPTQISTLLEIIPKGTTSAVRARLLSTLAPKLPQGLFPKALQLIQTEITHPRYQAEALSNLAPYLPTEQLTEALELIEDHITGFTYPTTALCNLIPYLSIPQLQQALVIAFRRIKHLELIAQILEISAGRICSIVEDKTKLESQLIESILDQTLSLTDEKSIANILISIVPSLDNSKELDRIITFFPSSSQSKIPKLKSEFYRAPVLAAISSKCSLIDFFLQQISDLTQEQPRVKAISAFISLQPDTQENPVDPDNYLKVVNIAKSLQQDLPNNLRRNTDLALIFATRPHPTSPSELDFLAKDQAKLLRLIRQQSRDRDKANYLIQIAPHLLHSLATEAQSIAQDLQDIYHKARSLVTLATHFPQVRNEARTQINQLKYKSPNENETKDKYLIQHIELMCQFATVVPEQIPHLLKTIEKWEEDNPFDSENVPTDPDHKKYKRTLILKALKPHLPIRLSREIDRETSIGKAPQDLWERSLFVLRNEYRQALKSGSFRNDTAQDEDLLNLKDEINALTEMLLMRDLTPPVAVGILGGWGGGKSYMMHLMQKHMVEIRSRGLDPVEAWGFKDNDDKNPDSSRLNRYVGHIYQIKFDAWTYSKSNLWASLMQTIFFELDRQISLEQQIDAALKKADPKTTSLASQNGEIWQALYEVSDEDREWFLKNVLNENWNQSSQNQTSSDQLWTLFANSQAEAIQNLEEIKSDLEKKKGEIQKKSAEILNDQTTDNALFDTVSQKAISILQKRLGKSFTEQIQKELTTKFKDIKDTNGDMTDFYDLVKDDIESVFEKKEAWMDLNFIKEFVFNNYLLILICLLLIFLAIYIPLELAKSVANSLIAQIMTGITPLLAAIPIAQSTIKKGKNLYTQVKLEISSFTQQLEKNIKHRIATNPELIQLNQDIQRLEREVKVKSAAIPTDTYASLSDFVKDRVQKGGYQEHLGMMHQVKEDLTMLSKRLLPPTADSNEYTAKVRQLKKVFPRGSARVVLYIDDLDRCPPKTVVEVLEAVQLLVKNPLFIAVLAIDERYITRALADHYKGVLPLKGRPSASDYLEKIIQIPYRIRPISEQALRQYLRAQIVVQDSETSGTKFNEFSPEEFNLLVACCQESELSPRSLKRLTNVYKLYKVLSRTRGQKPTPKEQKTILTLLAFSSRYPDLMRDILQKIGSIFEQSQNADNEKVTLFNVFKIYLEDSTKNRKNSYLEEDVKQLAYDVEKLVDKKLELNEIRSIFDFVRTFSFVGDIGVDHT